MIFERYTGSSHVIPSDTDIIVIVFAVDDREQIMHANNIYDAMKSSFAIISVVAFKSTNSGPSRLNRPDDMIEADFEDCIRTFCEVDSEDAWSVHRPLTKIVHSQ